MNIQGFAISTKNCHFKRYYSSVLTGQILLSGKSEPSPASLLGEAEWGLCRVGGPGEASLAL